MTQVVIPYAPRKHQREIHASRKRFSVLVCHRRFGKTVCAINELIKEACINSRTAPPPRYAYIAPIYKQAKTVVWDYLKHFAGEIPGTKFNEAELRCDLPNGARITLYGADNPDSLRGIYLDGVVLDEMAQMRPTLWGEVIRPTLSDYKGFAIFIGTPKGHNVFYDTYRYAQNNTKWLVKMYKASETGILDPEELKAAKEEMSPEQYEQEFECSFSAAIIGAYYGKIMASLDKQNRFVSLTIDPALLVHTAWDLGMADSMVIWFFQIDHKGELRVVDYLESSGEGLEFYIKALEAKGYKYGTHIAPHDINVRELGSGKSRYETALKLGLQFQICNNIPIIDGIEAARVILPDCWFDIDRCNPGIEALMQYRSGFNEKGGVFTTSPVHDWTSHAADAFRYLAVGLYLCEPNRFEPPRKPFMSEAAAIKAQITGEKHLSGKGQHYMDFGD